MLLEQFKCLNRVLESDLPKPIKHNMLLKIHSNSLASDNCMYYFSPEEPMLVAVKYVYSVGDFEINIYVYTQCDNINYVINKNIYITSDGFREKYYVNVLGSLQLSAYTEKYEKTCKICIIHKTKYFDQDTFSLFSYSIEEFEEKIVNVKQVFAPIIIGDTIGQSVAEYFKLIENKLDVEYKRFNINNDEINRTILSTKIFWPGYKGFTEFELDD